MTQRYETEAQFQAAVMDAAERQGWQAYHVPDSRRVTSPGFPDLVLAHPSRGRLVFAELKTNKGRLSEHQRQWLWALENAGAEVHVWRPVDWEGSITAVLAGRGKA